MAIPSTFPGSAIIKKCILNLNRISFFVPCFVIILMNLSWLKCFGGCMETAKHGFFINDLHRHPLAYHSIRILTSLFSKSYLVKNDAPLSVLRGFKKKELEDLLIKQALHIIPFNGNGLSAGWYRPMLNIIYKFLDSL